MEKDETPWLIDGLTAWENGLHTGGMRQDLVEIIATGDDGLQLCALDSFEIRTVACVFRKLYRRQCLTSCCPLLEVTAKSSVPTACIVGGALLFQR